MIARKFFEKNRQNAIISEKINNVWLGKSQKDILKMTNESMRKLQDANVKPYDRVAFCGKNSSEWLAWNLATYNLGATWVPLYDNQNDSYVNCVINDCEPKVLITDKDICVEPRILSTKLEGNDSENIIFSDHVNDLAALIYTSGTSGPPKGAKITHLNILSNLEAIQDRYSNYHSKRSLAVLPWAHIYGLTCELYYNLFNDTTTFVCTDKVKFIDECREVKPETIYVVPKILDMIKLKVETSFLKYLQPYIIRYILGGNIDIIFTGGAKLCESTKNFYIKNNILVTEGYGCTETSPIISLNGIDHPSRDVNTAGKILDNLKVTIDNGEICVSGPSVIEGYWNKAPFGNPIYRTGDLGSIDKDNFLTINGRLNDNYKLSNGKFVDVNKTEELIKKHINGFYMVFGRNAQHNSIVSDQNISETDLKVLNKELDNINVIKKAYYLPTEKFLEFTTPKLSIKRNILELYIKNTYE